MTRPDRPAQFALFDAAAADHRCRLELEPGAVVLRAFAFEEARALLATIVRVARASQWRHMTTVRGWRMSVAMTKRDLDAPIVSVPLGAPATFLWGGRARAERPRKLLLEHGDIVVWGGTTRLHFHGVDKLRTHAHELTGNVRFNLTFRRAR